MTRLKSVYRPGHLVVVDDAVHITLSMREHDRGAGRGGASPPTAACTFGERALCGHGRRHDVGVDLETAPDPNDIVKAVLTVRVVVLNR